MTTQQPEVLVIGAGVSGLTTAICLAEAGCGVTVAAARRAPLITSAAAGAIWGPHLVGIDERVTRWGAVTLARLAELAADPASGVHLASGVAASTDGQAAPFDWAAAMESVRLCDPAELPDGYAVGWRLTSPIVSMSVYLGYLAARLDRAGGKLREAQFGSLAEAAETTGTQVIVNCSGIGSRYLVPDPGLVPVRGQVVVVENPGLSEFFLGAGDAPSEIYYFPHGDIVVLGGTEEEGNWSLDPDPATAERILRACAAVQPRLAGATVTAHRVGLRPVRPSVRLEAEALDGGTVLVHNYGHGGAGVTLSWGCALEVAATVLG